MFGFLRYHFTVEHVNCDSPALGFFSAEVWASETSPEKNSDWPVLPRKVTQKPYGFSSNDSKVAPKNELRYNEMFSLNISYLGHPSYFFWDTFVDVINLRPIRLFGSLSDFKLGLFWLRNPVMWLWGMAKFVIKTTKTTIGFEMGWDGNLKIIFFARKEHFTRSTDQKIQGGGKNMPWKYRTSLELCDITI